jgi:hypothetical protein
VSVDASCKGRVGLDGQMAAFAPHAWLQQMDLVVCKLPTQNSHLPLVLTTSMCGQGHGVAPESLEPCDGDQEGSFLWVTAAQLHGADLLLAEPSPAGYRSSRPARGACCSNLEHAELWLVGYVEKVNVTSGKSSLQLLTKRRYVGIPQKGEQCYFSCASCL